MKVIFNVKNSKHYTKENKELDCLECGIICHFDKEENGGEVKDLIETWKDFKQKALDFSIDLKKEDIEITDKGYKIQGFSIPWNIQFFVRQLINYGYIK